MLYSTDQALIDFKTVAFAAGVNPLFAAEAIEAVEDPTDFRDGIHYLGALFEECMEFDEDEVLEDHLLDSESFLYTITLAADGTHPADVEGLAPYFDEEGKKIAAEGTFISCAGADAWIVRGENLFRVHPEGATPLGSYASWIQKQVELAAS